VTIVAANATASVCGSLTTKTAAERPDVMLPMATKILKRELSATMGMHDELALGLKFVRQVALISCKKTKPRR